MCGITVTVANVTVISASRSRIFAATSNKSIAEDSTHNRLEGLVVKASVSNARNRGSSLAANYWYTEDQWFDWLPQCQFVVNG